MFPGGVCIPGNKQLSAQERVNQEWNAMAGDWDDVAGSYAVGFCKMLWPSTGLDPNSSNQMVVVDFGCGTGLLTDKLRNHSSKIVAIDASPNMIDLLQDKILTREWENVTAVCATIARIANTDSTEDASMSAARSKIEELYGTVDLVVASSVFNFIPPEDIEATMQVIGKMIKPGGILCHSDWPKSEAKHPDAMTDERAERLFAFAGLKPYSRQIVPMNMHGQSVQVFLGVARKDI